MDKNNAPSKEKMHPAAPITPQRGLFARRLHKSGSALRCPTWSESTAHSVEEWTRNARLGLHGRIRVRQQQRFDKDGAARLLCFKRFHNFCDS